MTDEHAPHRHHEPHHDHGSVGQPTPVKDPVCGECPSIPRRRNIGPSTTEGNSYFSLLGRLSRQVRRRAAALRPAEHNSNNADIDSVRTARSTPVRCIPKCGRSVRAIARSATLEPVLATAETGPSRELVDMTRRFCDRPRGCASGAPPRNGRPSHPASTTFWAARPRTGYQFVLATPVVLWAGWPFFVRGARSVVTLRLNMFTLIAMGTGVAWAYSVVATVAPKSFRRRFATPTARWRSISKPPQ